MLELVAENSVLRMLLLVLAVRGRCCGGLFLDAQAFAHAPGRAPPPGRGRRGPAAEPHDAGVAAHRTRSKATWLKLVNSIEKRGLQPGRHQGRGASAETDRGGLTRALRAAGLHAGPPGDGDRPADARRCSFSGSAGSSPSVMKLYFYAGHRGGAGPLPAQPVHPRARPTGVSRRSINAFPDALDLMLVCVEAGLGLEAAFSRVGMEMTTSHPLLAEQFGAVVLELRAGRSHEDALRRMADRAGADEIRAFATLADPVDQARLVDRADACAPMRRRCARSGACAPRKRRTACRC